MGAWTEPYQTPDLLRYGFATAMSIFGLVPMCGVAAEGAPPLGWVAAAIFVVFWETMLWRITLTGLYLGDKGVKVRMVHRTRFIPWSNLDRAWIGPATNYRAWALWISTRRPAKEIETPIWREGSAPHRNRHHLDVAEFARLVDRINTEAAQRAAG